jgi:hypothetical protein
MYKKLSIMILLRFFLTCIFTLIVPKWNLILPLLREQHITVSNMTILPWWLYPYFFYNFVNIPLFGIIIQQHINQNENKNFDKIKFWQHHGLKLSSNHMHMYT